MNHESEIQIREAVLTHEQQLRYESFGRADAWRLGQKIRELAEETYGCGVVTNIYLDGMLVFKYSMDGCDLKNEWWLQGKLNTAQKYQCSSLLAMLRVNAGLLEHSEKATNNYLLCGGGFPIRLCSGEIRGYVIVSGLSHWSDHQVIADAMAACLNRQIPSVSDSE